MIQILLHSSKTMRIPQEPVSPLGDPSLLPYAKQLADAYQELPIAALVDVMKISPKKAIEVQELYGRWSAQPSLQVPAIDVFIGDIYSGLQVQAWSPSDRAYAHERLLILSGLYGGLHACDGIMPYRLEMAYKLPRGESLYQFWGDKIARAMPAQTTHIINLSAVEYTKAVLPYVNQPVTTPRFLTRNAGGEPIFVTVHAKIARGAFARWMIQRRIDDPTRLNSFAELGYTYSTELSTEFEPVFICRQFEGIGLSVRGT